MGKKATYGSGNPEFLKYVKMIVEHPHFAGMPDLHKEDGTIQWETPSNRLTGKYKDSNQKRRDWWAQRAKAFGIIPESSKWLSRTAKANHPTGMKPCKDCGRVLNIAYVYPTVRLLERVRNLPYFESSFPLDPLEHVLELLARLVEHFGEKVVHDVPSLLTTGSLSIPSFKTLDDCLQWVSKHYIPREPRTLSPGAMSNAPDRLDGFHSFNLCCRSKTDTGRHKTNLQSYVTDRRVFEYWVEGDWVAANTLMGIIRSDANLQREPCANGHEGPCSADHVGPISLGFLHRPSFRLLCNPCNSARNNRMALADVLDLITVEKRGESVASWYAKPLWDLRKADVTTDEMALRLSKLLRDNRHTFMAVLLRLAKAGHFVFLATLLDLDMADHDVEFVNIRTANSIVVFDKMLKVPRTTKYATEQKARRVRVGFEALQDYFAKLNRNAFIVSNKHIETFVGNAIHILKDKPKEEARLDAELALLQDPASGVTETHLRNIATLLTSQATNPSRFRDAKNLLKSAMSQVAAELSGLWTDDRYVRTLFENTP